eukprot:jgi/Antlo1/867/1978
MFGDVISIELDDGGCATVEFRRREDAENILAFIESRQHSSGMFAEIVPPQNVVFVDRIPGDISIGAIKKFFSKFGEIAELEVERTYSMFQTLKITYAGESDALRCIEKVNRKVRFTEAGELLVAKHYDIQAYQAIMNMDEDADDKCVFIYNLPPKYTDNELLELFSAYGKIRSAKVVANNKAFVNYESAISALKAAKYMDSLLIGENKINVVVKSQKRRKTREPSN